ncbi:nuclear transport factor 2 family protein [Streptomyces sp. NPDC007851]|uniref:nuclear transport factor 2 family protein n=1 Tax=Streptomyces sp. NPDC007851 TaxID=3155008 RepID=UPI0033F94687
MINGNESEPVPASPTVTSAGVRHVLLTYHYEDVGDFEGYASLLTDDVTFDHPGAPPARGRGAVLHAHIARATLRTQHQLITVVAEDHTVVVLGRLVRSAPGALESSCGHVDFADVFTLSAQCLVRSRRRYYYEAPS